MTENPFGLRIAQPTDAEALFSFALPLIRESALQPVSEERARRLVERCVYRDRAIAAVITGPDGLQGAVGATMDTFDTTDEPHVMVRWLGVAKAHRNTDLGARLVKFCGWMHQTLGGDAPIPVFLPLLTTSDQQRKMALYARRAPQVCVLHGFGALTDRELLTLLPRNGDVGRAKPGVPAVDGQSPA